MRIYREITPVRKEDVFILLSHPNAGFDYPLHNHPEYELNLVLNGAGNRIVGDSIDKYSNKDLVLIGPNIYHRWDSNALDKETRDQPPHVITIQFGEHLFDHTLLTKEAFYSIRLMLEQSIRGIQFYGSTLDLAIERLKNLSKTTGFQSVLDFLSLLNFLSNSVEKNYLVSPGFSNKPDFSKSRRINQVYEYILEHFSQRINLQDVASIANMSESAFSHFFKKSTNKSFTQFVIDLRIGYACKLLLESHDTISEICYKCGFSNLSNFNRLFKKNKGLPPYQYRKQFENRRLEPVENFAPLEFK